MQLARERSLVKDGGLILGMEGVIPGMGRFILEMERPSATDGGLMPGMGRLILGMGRPSTTDDGLMPGMGRLILEMERPSTTDGGLILGMGRFTLGEETGAVVVGIPWMAEEANAAAAGAAIARRTSHVARPTILGPQRETRIACRTRLARGAAATACRAVHGAR